MEKNIETQKQKFKKKTEENLNFIQHRTTNHIYHHHSFFMEK